MNKKKLAIATVIGGLIIYNMAEKKESKPNSTDLWDSQLDALWAKRVKLIDLNDFPSITKKSWCGLNFGNKSTPEQDDFEVYLKQYKNNTLSEVQSLPASNLYGNLDGYKKLSCMEPSNKSFQEKTAYYENKIQAENNKNKERSQSAWSYRVSTDEMTQKESLYLSSKTSTTTRPMSFPYTGTESSIYFACDKNSKWAYFWFSKKPNIRNDKTESGYNTSKSRISFDDNLDSITMTQEWGSQFMHVSYNNWLSKNLMGKKTLKLELDWHGEGRTVFLYDVQGFKPLYSDFIKKCSTL